MCACSSQRFASPGDRSNPTCRPSAVPLASMNYLPPTGQSAVLWDGTAADALFTKLKGDQPVIKPAATPHGKSSGGLQRSQVPVEVYNGTLIGGLSAVLRLTAWGRRVRATSDDLAVARLQGVRVRPLFAAVTGIAIAAAALAGTLNAVTTGVDPTLGTLTLIFAFEAVVIGGLGSLWGTLAGGMMLGVTQVLVSQVSVPYATLASQLLFLVVLAARPQGLFGSALAVS